MKKLAVTSALRTYRCSHSVKSFSSAAIPYIVRSTIGLLSDSCALITSVYVVPQCSVIDPLLPRDATQSTVMPQSSVGLSVSPSACMWRCTFYCAKAHGAFVLGEVAPRGLLSSVILVIVFQLQLSYSFDFLVIVLVSGFFHYSYR